jgi:hypothetical protein
MKKRLAREKAVSDLIVGDSDGWKQNPESLDVIAKAQLPYMRAMSDPNNLVAAEAGAEQLLSELPGSKRITTESNPEVMAILKSHNDRLNELTGHNYPLPNLIVVDGPATRDGDSAVYSSDRQSIIISADYFRDPVLMARLDYVLGHELGHRHEFSDESLLTTLKLTAREQFRFSVDQEIVNQHMAKEIQADFRAAQVVGVHKAELGLFARHATVAARMERDGVDYITARDAYLAQTPEQQNAEFEAFNALPEDQQLHHLDRAQRDIIPRSKGDGHHALPSDTMRMFDLLREHPELLQKNLEFDAKANPILDNTGPSNVQNISSTSAPLPTH